jgi:hypothetical protein
VSKRNIFGELLEGVTAMRSHREAKLTLRSYKAEAAADRRITVPVRTTDATVRGQTN